MINFDIRQVFLALYIILKKGGAAMFTVEELKALEDVSAESVTCTDEICNAKSSGCAWG